jgi:hypothetical protein
MKGLGLNHPVGNLEPIGNHLARFIQLQIAKLEPKPHLTIRDRLVTFSVLVF